MKKEAVLPITPFETYLEKTQHGTEVHYEYEKYELLSGNDNGEATYFLIDYHTGLTYHVDYQTAEQFLDLYENGNKKTLLDAMTSRITSDSSHSYSQKALQ